MINILVIDDSKAVHAFIEACFQGLNVHLVHAFDGKQGVEVYEQSRSFDLILLDWEMPVLDGPATLKSLKMSGVQSPVVMMTTRNSFEDITGMLSAGAGEYILKPFTKDILKEKLELVLGRVFQIAA